MSQIKINRARQISIIGNCSGSFAAMLEAIPTSVIARLPSREVAALIDANWRLAQASKSIAAQDALFDGGVWDSSAQSFRALSQKATAPV